MKEDSPTLREIQKRVDQWITTVGVRYFSPLTNMAILAEETGEVARQMARIYGEQSFKEGERESLADELADLLWVTVAIANQSGIDLTAAFEANIEKKNRRDSERHRHLADTCNQMNPTPGTDVKPNTALT